MSRNNGWISLNRDIKTHWLWSGEFSIGQAWIDLLLNANHSDAKVMIKSQLIEVKRGQQARSEVTLAKTWGWSRNRVRRFLAHLERDLMAVVESGHLTSVITICNYNDFQSSGTSNGTAKGHLTEQQEDSRRNTNNNVNNENNVNNVNKLDFNDFYTLYPKKERKKDTKAKWDRLPLKDQQKAIDGIASFTRGKENKFICAPIVYLNGERWEDESTPNQATKTDAQHRTYDIL